MANSVALVAANNNRKAMDEMKQRYWLKLIRDAVAKEDSSILDSLAAHLARCEDANGILRAKGYGESGNTIDATARLVPERMRR